MCVCVCCTFPSKLSCCISWSLLPMPMKAQGCDSCSEQPSRSICSFFFFQPLPIRYTQGGGQKNLHTEANIYQSHQNLKRPHVQRLSEQYSTLLYYIYIYKIYIKVLLLLLQLIFQPFTAWIKNYFCMNEKHSQKRLTLFSTFSVV